MSDFRPRGRPRSEGTGFTCGRCDRATDKIRVRWPDGQICGICFTEAVHTYGVCPSCGKDHMLPGRASDGLSICRECAGISTELTCIACGREAERFRDKSCITCVLRRDLTALLKPNSPPDLRLRRLVEVLANADRPESIYTWMRPADSPSANLLRLIGNREIELTHAAFDGLVDKPSARHMRAILVHHHILPDQGDPELAVFEQWLARRLDQLSSTPEIHSPIERFARWHHLRRLKEASAQSTNMNYATRSAKQEITEAGKFLKWLREEHGCLASQMSQVHIDQYLAEGTSTRTHIRNFVRYMSKEQTVKGVDVKHREAQATPLLTQNERLAFIRLLMEAENVGVSIRVAGLIFLLYGTPIGRLSRLTVDDLIVRPTGMTLKLGSEEAPVPEEFVPLFWSHIQAREGQQTVNTGTRWLFPGSRAGQPRSPNTLLGKLRNLGMDVQGIRNATLKDLVAEVDPKSLGKMLGYSRSTLSRHATAATIPWMSYVAAKNPHYAVERGTPPVGPPLRG